MCTRRGFMALTSDLERSLEVEMEMIPSFYTFPLLLMSTEPGSGREHVWCFGCLLGAFSARA